LMHSCSNELSCNTSSYANHLNQQLMQTPSIN